MDWPTASLLLGVLGSVTVAVLKIVPQRTVVENSKGEQCATREDIRNLQQQLGEHSKYMGTRNHDIINAINASGITLQTGQKEISHDLITLLERTRRFRVSNEDD